VSVHKTDTNFPATWELAVKQTNDGQGNGTIIRDTAFHVLSDIPFVLFTGSGNRTNLRPRYRLRDVSVADGYGNFLTTITYTVTRL
jgi:hypothetical protein